MVICWSVVINGVVAENEVFIVQWLSMGDCQKMVKQSLGKAVCVLLSKGRQSSDCTCTPVRGCSQG